MAYDKKIHTLALLPRSNAMLTAANLAATAADWAEVQVLTPILVNRLLFSVTTTATAGLVAGAVTYYRRPTAGSNSGQVLLGTVTVANATAAGKVVYKDIESVRLNVGEGLAFRVNVQCTDNGTAAGAGFAGVEAVENAEVPANMTQMVASA